MYDLLDLPSEILGKIFGSLIIHHSVRNAVKARLACKYFDTEIVRSIWTTRALEGHDRPRPISSSVGDRILVSYLASRTLTDRQRQHYLTVAIYEALEYIQNTLPTFVITDEAIHKACSAVVHNSKLPDPSCVLEPTQSYWSPAEHALALAAYMGLDSVVQTIVEHGFPNRDTYFGHSFYHVARSWNSSLVSKYLEWKLKVVQSQIWPTYGACGRDISFTQYREAMRLAIHENSREVLDLIMDAARQDGKLDKPENGTFLPQLNVRRHGTTSIQNFILLHAIYARRYDIAKMALDDGADPKQGVKASTLLDIAAGLGDAEMLGLLLDSGADMTFCIRRSPLTTAVFHGHEKAVKFCLDYGMTDFSRTTPAGTWVASVHPLVVAGRENHLHILQTLLNHGIVFDIGSELDKCLTQAADPEMEKILAVYRANPTQPSSSSSSSSSKPVQEAANDSASLAYQSFSAAVRAQAHTMKRTSPAPQLAAVTIQDSPPSLQISPPSFEFSLEAPQRSTAPSEMPASAPQIAIPTLEVSAPSQGKVMPSEQPTSPPATLSPAISCPNLRDAPKSRPTEDAGHKPNFLTVEQPRLNKTTPPRGLRKVRSFLSQSAVFRAIRAV